MPLLLVLDGFDAVLDHDRHSISHNGLSILFRQILDKLTGIENGARAVVTTSVIPIDVGERKNVRVFEVPEMSDGDLVKFMRRDDWVARRLENNEIPLSFLKSLHGAVGGLPGTLDLVRTAFRSMGTDELFNASTCGESHNLERIRNSFLEQMLQRHLLKSLSSEARTVMDHLSISVLPLPIQGIQRITGLTEQSVQSGLDELAQRSLIRVHWVRHQPIYDVPALLRRLRVQASDFTIRDIRQVHRSLAEFWKAVINEDEFQNLLSTKGEAGAFSESQVSMVCRQSAGIAEDAGLFRWATIHWTWNLINSGYLTDARQVIREVPYALPNGETDLERMAIQYALERLSGRTKDAETLIDALSLATPRNPTF